MDFSVAHAPVGGFVEQPRETADWQKYLLSPEQLAGFQKDGYVAGVQVLNDVQVDTLRSELDGLMAKDHPAHSLFHEYHSNETNDPNAVLFHALGAWRTGPGFHDVLWSPAFLAPASQLLGGPVRFWHDQLFCKPAHHGAVVAWHQDYSYWTRTEPMSHLTCWIALDDSDRNNGCLYYVPGSHRWRLLPRTGLTGNMDEIMTVLTEEQKAAFHPVPIELKKGQCTFHHPLMVHGSFENRSDRPRRATLINAFRDGVQSAADEPLLQGVPVIARGAKMEGQFFPLLFNPADVIGG
jgi:Phytanoyl-CoA dioxygenase (PhyH)